MVLISNETALFLPIIAFRCHHCRDHAYELYGGQYGAPLGKATGDEIREHLQTFNYLKRYLGLALPSLIIPKDLFRHTATFFLKALDCCVI